MLSYGFIQESFSYRDLLISESLELSLFHETIYFENLEAVLGDDALNYFFTFTAVYLGQIARIPNYSNSEFFLNEKLSSDGKIYYINSFFQRINETSFSDESKYVVSMVYEDPMGYNIYVVKSR